MAQKKLTKDNWDQHDPLGSFVVCLDENGVQSTPMGKAWAEAILEPQLKPSVPNEVVDMFEAARGILVYGWFYYPLCTMGCEQLYHVKEAAVTHRCAQLLAPKSIRTFYKRLDWLHRKKILDDKRMRQWEGARGLRNIAAHKKKQSILAPTDALSHVNIASELINELFEEN